MLPFLQGLTGRNRPTGHPLLDELVGQSIIHTRVAARGTWTITARGWSLHARIHHLTAPGLEPGGEAPVGLRDPRVIGARLQGGQITGAGRLELGLEDTGPLSVLSIDPAWRLEGPYGAVLEADARGTVSATPPNGPVHATAPVLAELVASTPTDLEIRLQDRARERWLHPGDVVEVLAQAGALREEEFEARGPLLLARMLAREELRAGFVSQGTFSPWDLDLPQVVEHIATTWRAIGGRDPEEGMIAWFELTDSGRDSLGPTSSQVMPPGMSGYDSPGVVGGFR